MILCKGTMPDSLVARNDIVETITTMLHHMNPVQIIAKTGPNREGKGGKGGHNKFAHMLSGDRPKTAVLRDIVFWLCKQKYVSPLFMDWSHIDNHPIENEDQAWAYVAENLINVADGTGRGCLDIACAESMGGGDESGKFRVESLGGKALTTHHYRKGHINFSRQGWAYTRA